MATPDGRARTGQGRADVAPGQPRVRMPSTFTAFCLLHHRDYLRYCRARLPTGCPAEPVVEGALGDLATQWPAVLSSPRVEAAAWSVLRGHVARAAARRPCRGGANGDLLHRLLPAPEADAVVLCRRLSLDRARAAELMGISPWEATCRLLRAERALPPDVLRRLPRAGA
ncbi:hypothetical protein RM780_05390 [Streptomyces sp. DSM 44917]|uniref:RNA polymerase sigma factor 70 region 4 type 2 domain-containing protein n=1 Tax=Streptomyces boetiae TaxID=3075541 RepID=A0ABU2L4A9_9ACTN|nr:hypothetical protein [Streptomyces sp. DSM 44917]MDT0306395.1 hypothetical protein [Streptomyces sp. DSM 44917]